MTQTVRDEILAGQKPLGRVLIDHNVLRHIDLGAVLRIAAGPSLARLCKCRPAGLLTAVWPRSSAIGTPRSTCWRSRLPLLMEVREQLPRN